jgi:hypothetical protein
MDGGTGADGYDAELIRVRLTSLDLGRGLFCAKWHRDDRILVRRQSVVFQSREQDLGPLGIRPMDRLAVVPQRLHRESFRIASLLGPFCPGIPLTVQCHPADT